MIEDNITPFFMSFLGILFFSFFLILILQLRKSREGIKWFHELLKNTNSDNVAAQRFDLKKKADNKDVNWLARNLWLEFNETLIEIQEDDKIRLYLTTHQF